MRDRIITAVLGLVLILYALFLNTTLFNVLVAFLIIMCTYELISMFSACHGVKLSYWPFLGSAFFYLAYFLYPESWGSFGLALIFFVGTGSLVVLYPRVSYQDYLYGIFVPIYGSWTAVHLMAILHGEKGLQLLLYFFIAIWLCDTGAYFSGRFFGERKLAPELSPNKTLEGAIGGLGLAVFAGLGFQWIVPVFDHMIYAVIFSLIFGLGGILGDLFESFLKRYCCVKDSGCILPGHGGFLDRFDAILFVAPLATYMFALGQSYGFVL